MAESERQNAKSFGDVVPVVDVAHHPGKDRRNTEGLIMTPPISRPIQSKNVFKSRIEIKINKEIGLEMNPIE